MCILIISPRLVKGLWQNFLKNTHNSHRIGQTMAEFGIEGMMDMQKHSLPPMPEPDMASRRTEIRMQERYEGIDAREREAVR